MPLTAPLAQVLGAVVATGRADRDQLDALAAELRGLLPRQQLTVSRRGFPLVGSRVVGLRVLLGDHVFRVDTTTGTTVTEIGRALNGVVSQHHRVPAAQWAAGLRDALQQF